MTVIRRETMPWLIGALWLWCCRCDVSTHAASAVQQPQAVPERSMAASTAETIPNALQVARCSSLGPPHLARHGFAPDRIWKRCDSIQRQRHRGSEERWSPRCVDPSLIMHSWRFLRVVMLLGVDLASASVPGSRVATEIAPPSFEEPLTRRSARRPPRVCSRWTATARRALPRGRDADLCNQGPRTT